SAYQYEREKVFVLAGVFLSLRLFERLKNTISNAHGVCQALQPGCEAFEFLVSEITMALACCEDEIVVWDMHLRAIRRGGKNITLFFVHAGHLRHDHGRVALLPQNAPNRSADLPGSKHRGRHLVKQRLKDVVIGAVKQNNFRATSAESFSCRQAAK